jgi:hypothetical protein
MFRWLEIIDKNQLYDLYQKTFSYESLIKLQKFNHSEFINEFNEKDLIYYTNEFIKNIANDTNFCKNYSDLIIYYKKWEDFFKNKSTEYLNYVDSMLEEIINDIENNKTFESKNWEYNEYKISGAYKIFKEFYKQVFPD